MFFPTKEMVLQIHARLIQESGGCAGLRDEGILDSCLIQPLNAFGGQDLYPNLLEKAAALGFFLVVNHPFVDGNKRIGQAAMEITFVLNGYEIEATVDEQEKLILDLASGILDKETFIQWVKNHLRPLSR
ncbi:MAG: type II toxin-antitoxin system death-on-curing family toxin [Bacteroidota bacterium]